MPQLNVHSGWIGAVFVIGYSLITFEHFLKISKTTAAMFMAIFCWMFLFTTKICPDRSNVECLLEHLANVSQIIFFILGALAIVETINLHHGFKVICNYINVQSKRKLLWIISFVAFFLSSILDNLTTTIVMVTLLCKLIPKGEDRLMMGGAVVIAANAGGAWTPIGDVTTTMLWIGGQLTTAHMMAALFVPSMVCLIVSLICFTFMLKGDLPQNDHLHEQHVKPYGNFILALGVGALVFVPIFKILTGLPPFMGMLLGLSVMWLVTDFVHKDHAEKDHLSVPHALTRIDHSSVLFFLGILLCIDALNLANILDRFALWLDASVGNTTIIATLIGLISAVVDNVPLVAASMGMYDFAQHPIDSQFWDLIAYCAGTGGSILIIGSAAGVVFMGMEKVNFIWYLKRISVPALVGYLAGILSYLIMH